MGEWEPAQLAIGGGLVIGLLFGAVAQATAFCSSGAVLDIVRSGDANRLRAWRWRSPSRRVRCCSVSKSSTCANPSTSRRR